MGKTRYPFKKIRDTKGTFHAKMGSIKDRNGRDLTEAEDMKKRQEYWSGLPFPFPGIFLTQGLNLGLLHHRRTLYHLSPQGRFLCPPLFPGVCSQCALDKW